MRALLFCCLAICLFLAPLRADEEPNLIPNGDFAQGITGWKLEGADRTQSAIVPVAGQPFKRSLRVKVEPKSGDKPWTVLLSAPPAVNLQPEKEYFAGAWVRSSEPDTPISLQIPLPGKNPSVATNQTVTNQWQLISVLGKIPEGQGSTYPFAFTLSAKPATIEIADFRVSELTIINAQPELKSDDKLFKPDLNLQVGHTESISAIDVFPDGKRLVSVSWDGGIKIWDIATQRVIRSIFDSLETIRVKVSTDGSVLAVSTNKKDTPVHLYQSATGNLIKSFLSDSGALRDIVLTKDFTHLIGASSKIQIWNLHNDKVERVLQGHTDVINALAFSGDDRILASASNDKTVKLWDWANGKLIKTFTGFDAPVWGVDISPDGTLLVASARTSFKLIDMPTGEVKRNWSINQDITNTTQGKALRSRVHFSSNGKWLLGCSEESSQVFTWDVATGDLVAQKTNAIGNGATDSVFSIDTKSVFSPNENFISRWNVESGKAISQFGKVGLTLRLSQSRDEKYCSLSSEGATPLIWNLQSGFLETDNGVFSTQNEYRSNEWSSPDSAQKYRASTIHQLGNKGRQILITQISSGSAQALVNIPRGSAKEISASLNGKRILTGGQDGVLRIYELPSWRLLATMFTLPSVDGNTTPEWITTTPEGYYNCSSQAARFVDFNLGAEQYPVECFSAQYYRPDMVERALAGEKIPPPQEFKGAFPPQLWVASGENKSENGAATVTLHVEDDSAVKNVAFFVNGAKVEVTQTETKLETGDKRPITADGRPIPADGRAIVAEGRPIVADGRPIPADGRTMPVKVARTMTFRVPVPADGNAKVQMLAFDDDGLQSPRQELLFTPSEKVTAPVVTSGRLLGLCVGVSSYRVPKLNLKFAHKDALELTTSLNTQRGLYRSAHVTALTDGKATSDGVKAGLDNLVAQTTRDDTVVLLLAGHGWRGKETLGGRRNFFFATYELEPENIAGTAMPWSEVVSRLGKLSAKSKRVIVLLDACHSGSAAGNEELVKEILNANAGVMVLASSRGSEISLESTDWGHGAFTKAILEAVSGKASGADKAVSVWDFANYVKKRVATLTEDRQHPQVPFLSDFDTDAAIMTVDGAPLPVKPVVVPRTPEPPTIPANPQPVAPPTNLPANPQPVTPPTLPPTNPQPVAPPTAPVPAAKPELVLATGEIRFDGVVRAVDTAKRTITLEVQSFTLPNGKTSPITPPKPKTVFVIPDALIHSRGDTAKLFKLDALKVGQAISVLGTDLGSGQMLPAREIAVSRK